MKVTVESNIPEELEIEARRSSKLIDAIICDAVVNNGRNRTQDVKQIIETIDLINPRFPDDSFSAQTFMQMLDGNGMIDSEEFKIIEGLLPEYGTDRRASLRVSDSGMTLEFSFCGKHSGMYWKISFSSDTKIGLCFPLTVRLLTFKDMDQLSNHWLYNNPTDERCCEQGDCDCEADVAFDGEFTISGDEDIEKASEWLETNLFEGQS